MLEVWIEDMFTWLAARRGTGAVVTVLPDADEVGMGIPQWGQWFTEAAAACFAASSGPTVFMQTDRMQGGRWISKPALISAAAGDRPLLWHKIVLRRGPGGTDLHRPTYSHLLAYGPGRPGIRTPDVIERGRMRWANGMGEAVAAAVAAYLAAQGTRAVLNPCCGHGTMLAAALAAGMDAFGCDIDAGRAAIASAVTPCITPPQ